MNGLELIFPATLLLIASGLPACFRSRTSVPARRLTTALLLLGSLLGGEGLLAASFGTPGIELTRSWNLPAGQFAIGLDPLSAVFLIPIFTIPILGSFYGWSYWRQSDHPGNGRSLRLFYGLLPGGIALVVLSRHSILFMIACELMALAAFLLAAAEDDKPEVRRAGWIYLVATHKGTVCLLSLFCLLRHKTRRAPAAVSTWTCGCAPPTPKMQYCGTSFGPMLISLFRRALCPRINNPGSPPFFPQKTDFSTEVADTLLEHTLLPFFHKSGRQMMKLRLL